MSNLSEMFEINSGCFSTFTLENTASVAEGGGQRGIYTAGVLDSLHKAGSCTNLT